MFVDASALTAMLTEETDARQLLARAQNHPVRFTSPLAVWETVIAVARVLGIDVRNAASAVEDFLVLTEMPRARRGSEPRVGGLRSVREGAASGSAEFRGLLRLCLCALCGGAVALQRRRFPSDRH